MPLNIIHLETVRSTNDYALKLIIDTATKPPQSVSCCVDPVLECSCTSEYTPLLRSVSPSNNSDSGGLEGSLMNNPNSLDLSSSDVAILADVQTAGRGRLNSRTWISVPGNFHCSYIINLERRGVSESCTAELTSTTLNSIRQLLLGLLERREGSGAGQKRIVPADISIKQPNDVLIRGRKVAGVLVEVYYPYAIIGVGINTTSAPLPTSTCILDELSVQVDNREIVTRLHSPSQSSDGDC